MIKTDLEANYQKPGIKILIIDTKSFICVSGGGENEGGDNPDPLD